MNIQEIAKVVAFAKLLGVPGTDKEISDKYTAYYQTALKSLSAQKEVEVFTRPF